jgi:hypothetical protein
MIKLHEGNFVEVHVTIRLAGADVETTTCFDYAPEVHAANHIRLRQANGLQGLWLAPLSGNSTYLISRGIFREGIPFSDFSLSYCRRAC